MSFFKKVAQKIEAFFIKLFGGLKKFTSFVQDNMGDIIAIVGNLLKYAGSPIIGDILTFLPGKFKEMGEDAQAKAISLLAEAIKKLNISNDCLSKPTEGEIIICFLDAFAKKSEKDKEGVAAKLAATMLQIKSEQDLATPLKDSQADFLSAQYFFAKKINVLEEAA